MIFQTLQNDQNNRDKNSPEGLEFEIRSIWLGRRFAKITFEQHDIECDVREIRELIDESSEDKDTPQC